MTPYSEVPARIKESLILSQSIQAAGVELKRRGGEWLGLCPFHDEKTPSFAINDPKGVYYCRGCRAKGDIISFHSDFYSVSPGEAIKALAAQAGFGIEPRKHTGRAPVRRQPKQATWDKSVLLTINRLAQKIFSEAAWGDGKFLAAMQSRSIRQEAAEAFGLGYYPSDLSIVDALRLCDELAGFSESQVRLGCQELGLLYRNNDDSPFVGRLIFPIADAAGEVVGFAGRDLGGSSKAKYINSPESLVFDKSRLLYGLTPLRSLVSSDTQIRLYWQALIRQQDISVVEGYTDVVALAESGIRAVAAMGTGFSDYHVHTILQAASRICCLYDGDSAGQDASRRTLLSIFPKLSDRHRLAALTLPEGHDPDSFLREFSNPEASRNGLAELTRVKPESVWWDEHVGEVSVPPSLADQVVIERAYANSASYPDSALWQLMLARRIQGVCGYRVRHGAVHREVPPWFGCRFTTQVQPIEDDVLCLWLWRFRRRPELIAPFCAMYRGRWWVNDLLLGRATYAGLPPAMVYLFAADVCLAGGDLIPDDWLHAIRQLLDNGFPAHWLKGWLASGTPETARDDATTNTWRFEWCAWIDSINESLVNTLLASISDEVGSM